MMAAVYRGRRRIAVEEVPVPTPDPGQVLLEVSHCGVCGTDIHMLYEDWGTPGSIAGHEYSGVIVAVGTDVSGWQIGDRVVGGPDRGCGTCRPCRTGRSNLCAARPRLGVAPFVGAFAGYKSVDAAGLYRVPDTLDLRTAALTEPVAVARHGLRKVDVEPGGRVLVTGAGPIGLLTVGLLRHAGASDITVSEPSELRRRLALRVGASAVVSPDRLEAGPDHPMEVVAEPFNVAFECSGRRQAMENALSHLDRGGFLVLSGTGLERPRFDPNRIILNELTVTGTVEYTPDDYEAALELLASGHLPTDALVEPADETLGGLEEALGRLGRGEVAGKVMVVPRA
jgi:L-iditol 2-dehydrogenase